MTAPRRRRPSNPRARSVRVPKALTPFPFLAELADIYGFDEAGEVARDLVRRTAIGDGAAVVLTLRTNPRWRADTLHDPRVPGGERGLVYRADDGDLAREDGDQLTVAEAAMAKATLGEIAWTRAHQTLKQYTEQQIARYGSSRAFAAHLVDLVPGSRRRGESADAARERQIKAQIRKLQEWTQIYKKNGAPVNPKQPGQPKYQQPTRDNAARIAAARGDARRWAVRVLRRMRVDMGLRGWWRALSQADHQFPAEAETRPPQVAAVRTVIEATGADFIETCEETKHDAELLVLYLLKVTLHDVRRAVAAGPRDEA